MQNINNQSDTMLIQKQTLINIADAIRSKKESTDSYTPIDMPQAISEIETGIQLEPLENQAPSEKIFSGYAAYNNEGEIVFGSGMQPLENQAAAEQITLGYKAYNSNGEVIVGVGAEAGVDTLGDRLTGKLMEYSNEAVTIVPSYAFYGLSNLSSINLPNCASIGERAFTNCSSLEEVSFPKCTTIGTLAFQSCASLQKVDMSECSSIPQQAFQYCYNLLDFSFPKCTKIQTSAFGGCSKITLASFPECSQISEGAFYSCFELSEISFPKFSSQLYARTFTDCIKLISASFLNCTKISDAAFQNCKELTTAYFPKCSYINAYGFSSCYKLIDVSLPICTQLDTGVFQSCSSLESIQLPSCKTIYSYAFENCIKLSQISAPLLTKVMERVFNSCSNLLEVSFSSCTTVGSSAFRNCRSLTTAYLPKCSSIYSEAFYNCYNLSSITLSTSCTFVGSNAFAYCSSLGSAIFPNCTTIYNSGFYGCKGLTSISFPKVTTIQTSAFGQCTSLESVYFPSCTNLGSYAFSGCSNLKNASFPKMTSIYSGIFKNCKALEYFSFPTTTSGQTLQQSIFDGCTNLSSVNNFQPTAVLDYTFRQCKALQNVNPILTRATYVGSYAFQSCHSIKEVLASSCTTIYYSGFEYCSSLFKASFPKCNYIYSYAFYNCFSLYALFLTSTNVCGLGSSNAFYRTPIYSKTGYVFVPSSLVSKYKVSTNWSYYADSIVPISNGLIYFPVKDQVYYLETSQALSVHFIQMGEQTVPEFAISYDDSLMSCSITEVSENNLNLEIITNNIEDQGQLSISTTYEGIEYSTNFNIKVEDKYKVSLNEIPRIYINERIPASITLTNMIEVPQVSYIIEDETALTIENVETTSKKINFDIVAGSEQKTTKVKFSIVHLDKTYEIVKEITVFDYTYNIENVGTYGFYINDNGYYESNNKGVHSSAAVCKLNITVNRPMQLELSCINSGESTLDYGILSKLDTELALTNAIDATSEIEKSFSGQSSTTNIQKIKYEIPIGSHFIYIKFRKDSSVNNGNDSLQFKFALLEDYLGKDSWETISNYANSGQASEKYSIGDTKNVTLTTGEVITLQIIGFNHDTLSDGTGTAGITFQMKNCLAEGQGINATSGNTTGWTNSLMRSKLQPNGQIFESLPEELKNVIRPVDKITSIGGQSTTLGTTSDYGFLLSEMEIFGSASNTVSGEGTQYTYYKNGGSKIKSLANGAGNTIYWWSRSPAKSATTWFNVSTSGGTSLGASSNNDGISFAFCV